MSLLIAQVRSDYVFTGGAHSHAVCRLVVGAVTQTLPHRSGFRITDASTIINCVAGVCYLLDPIGKATEELAIVVRKARCEVERPFRSNGPYGTSSDAQLAFEAGVVVDRVVVRTCFTIHQNGAQKNEVAKLWVNKISVDSHVAEASLDSHRFMRNHP